MEIALFNLSFACSTVSKSSVFNAVSASAAAVCAASISALSSEIALIRALLFWYRCSELSADRAAVLCDGDPNTTIDVLLKIHGYDDENINREAFIKQALDLKEYVNESNANKMMELMMT